MDQCWLFNDAGLLGIHLHHCNIDIILGSVSIFQELLLVRRWPSTMRLFFWFLTAVKYWIAAAAGPTRLCLLLSTFWFSPLFSFLFRRQWWSDLLWRGLYFTLGLSFQQQLFFFLQLLFLLTFLFGLFGFHSEVSFSHEPHLIRVQHRISRCNFRRLHRLHWLVVFKLFSSSYDLSGLTGLARVAHLLADIVRFLLDKQKLFFKVVIHHIWSILFCWIFYLSIIK